MFQLSIKSVTLWLLLSIAITSFFSYSFLGGGPERIFTPGDMTHGHYQIELSCSACHTEYMGVKQDACLACHKEELEKANDSHPAKKFLDPRNADRLKKLDARYCITCHQEHQKEKTLDMGLSLPQDYCIHCHEDVADERPTHEGMPFDSCATAGCHNYHDNTALYEDFLNKHFDEPPFKKVAKVPTKSVAGDDKLSGLKFSDVDIPESIYYDNSVSKQWLESAHAEAGINCMDCHTVNDQWVEKPDHNSCKQCHEKETKGFLMGRHGMRLERGLSPMTPGDARVVMKKNASHKEMTCISCHSAHSFNVQRASVESCMSCHNDEHTLNYLKSPHYGLWLKEASGEGEEGTGVSCATCHMPRIEHTQFGVSEIMVQHNQNDNLRPNEKMIRTSCMNCHGLQFSINALADEDLIKKNFSTSPTVHIDSLDMARSQAK